MFRRDRSSYWINATSTVAGLNKNLSFLWEEVLSKCSRPYVLVVSDGDVTFSITTCPTILQVAAHTYCERIYAQNLVFVEEESCVEMKLRPIPIGLDLHTYRSGTTPRSLAAFLTERNEFPRGKTERAIVDFSASSVSPIRQEIIELAKAYEFYEKLPQRLGQFELWKKYRSASLVVSPRGGGLDCHRTWEALWFGCVVIVVSDKIEALFEGVPNVVLVTDLAELMRVDRLKVRCAGARSMQDYRVALHHFVLPEDLQFFEDKARL